MSKLPESFVDLLIVDPPYNLTKNFNGSVFRQTSNEEYEKLYSKVSTKYQKEIYKLSLGKDDVLDFIKAFSQAEAIITDSFHGVCFAIIFDCDAKVLLFFEFPNVSETFFQKKYSFTPMLYF